MSVKAATNKPTLYRQNDRGKLQQWRVWAERGDGSNGILCTEHGMVDGKLQSSRRDVSVAGHADTGYDKARQQVVKKWTDKQTKEGYTTDRTECDNKATGAGGAAAPMLASKVELNRAKGTIKNMPLPCLAQPKIDGFRCVARTNGGSGCGLYSRTKTAYVGFGSLRNIIDALPYPTSGFGSGRLYLDGELFVDTDNFSELSSQIKKGQHRPEYDLDALQYRVFDCFDLDFPDAPYTKRCAFVQLLLRKAVPRIHYLGAVTVGSIADVDTRMAEFLAAGHEGLMLRDPGSPYVLRKRSKYLQKHKVFHDDEFMITGFKTGSGNDAGTVVWLCETPKGHAFSVRPMGRREQRRVMFDSGAAYIGRMLTVVYQELSPDGVPRFPVGKACRESFDQGPA